MKRTRGIAVRGETIYLAGDKRVALHERDGARVRCVPLGEAPVALAAGSDGTLYVAMQHHVEVYAASGKRRARWERPGKRAWLTSVAVGGGRVWVGDAGQRLVLGYDPAGRLVARLGRRDAARGVAGILAPSPHLDVAGLRDGLLWVANPGRHRVEGYTPQGTVKRWWGKPGQADEGFCGCCNPTDLALLPEGRFVTAEKGILRVKVCAPGGQFERVVAGPETFAGGRDGLDLATDTAGRVFVLDRATGIVRVFGK